MSSPRERWRFLCFDNFDICCGLQSCVNQYYTELLNWQQLSLIIKLSPVDTSCHNISARSRNWWQICDIIFYRVVLCSFFYPNFLLELMTTRWLVVVTWSLGDESYDHVMANKWAMVATSYITSFSILFFGLFLLLIYTWIYLDPRSLRTCKKCFQQSFHRTNLVVNDKIKCDNAEQFLVGTMSKQFPVETMSQTYKYYGINVNLFCFLLWFYQKYYKIQVAR